MSGKPRSSLKKRSGNQDDRRVSFASPLSFERNDSSPHQKQLSKSITAKTTSSAVKKLKPSPELVDIITLVNQQSEVIEELFEIENKLSKQSTMAQELTISLTDFIESIANLSSDSTRIKSEFEQQLGRLIDLEGNITNLVQRADSICAEYDSKISAEAQYSSCLSDLQNAINSINCTNIDGADEPHVNYDNLLSMIDQLEASTDKF